MNEFTPPVKERPTEDLLKIVGTPEKWNQEAVRRATDELTTRNVDPKKIETARYLSKKRKRIKDQIKANKGYHVFDFLFHPLRTLTEITFSWELKKDGFPRKARQQKYFRISMGIILLSLFIYAYFK